MIFKKKQTVKDLLNINNEDDLSLIKSLIKSVKPSNVFAGFKWDGLLKMSYKDVQECRGLYANEKVIDLVVFITNQKVNKIVKQNYQSFIYFLAFINSEFEKLRMLENRLNQVEPEDQELQNDLRMCGVEELNSLKTIPTIDALAKGDFLKWKEVESESYEMVYAKLITDKIQAKVQRRYQKLISDRMKKK